MGQISKQDRVINVCATELYNMFERKASTLNELTRHFKKIITG